MKRRNKLFSPYFNNYLLFYFQDESVWVYKFFTYERTECLPENFINPFLAFARYYEKEFRAKRKKGIVKEQTVFVLSCILLFQKSYILICLRTISDPMKSENLLILHVIMYFKLTCFML